MNMRKIFSLIAILLLPLVAHGQKVSALPNQSTLASNSLFSVSFWNGSAWVSKHISEGQMAEQIKTDFFPAQGSLVDGSVNLDKLYSFKSKVETNGLVKVFVIGDSLATPGGSAGVPCGVSWGLSDILVQKYGLCGGFARAGNYARPDNGSTDIYGVMFKNGGGPEVVTDTVDYYGPYTVCTNGDFVECRNNLENGLIVGDQIGFAWIAGPNGGTITLSNTTAAAGWSTYSPLATVDGFAASPTFRKTNFTVALNSYKIKAKTVGDFTNKFCGPIVLNTTASGVSMFVMEHNGGNVTEIATSATVTRDALTNFGPDLIVVNLIDYADVGEATFFAGLTNTLNNIFTNAQSPVLYLGCHWRLPLDSTINDNRIIRRACLTNGWAFFDSAYEASSYYKSTNTAGFMNDTVHLAGGGSKRLADRFWSRMAIQRTNAVAEYVLPNYVLTNKWNNGTMSTKTNFMVKRSDADGTGMYIGNVFGDNSFLGYWIFTSETTATYGNAALLGNNNLTVLNSPTTTGGPWLRQNNSSKQYVNVAGDFEFVGTGATNVVRVSFNNGVSQRSGTGTPEGVVTAAIGSTFHRADGGSGTSFYVKESGTGNTGWVAK